MKQIIDRMEIIDAINQLSITYREENGHAKLEYCPFCENGKSLKDADKYKHFSINLETGAYYCFHRNSCGEQGGFWSFKDKLGLNPIMNGGRRHYNKPQPNSYIKTPEDKFYDWYTANRGISRDVLQKYDVSVLHREKDGKNEAYIVYKYMDNEKKEFNRKYRHWMDKKVMWTEKGCEQGFYGQQFVKPETAPFLVVVEGEDDVHAMSQMGINNVVSVPFGAGTYSPSMHDYIQQFKVVYLCHDNDTAGENGARKFAEKAGFDKCLRVRLPHKDARECLLAGMGREEISVAIGSAKQFSHDRIGCVDADIDGFEMWDFVSGNSHNSGIHTPHKYLNRLFKGIRYGEMTIITGGTGSGKTTFGDNLLHWIEEQGFPVMAFHFENKPLSVKCKLIEIQSKKAMYRYDEDAMKRVPLVSKEEYLDHVVTLQNSNWFLYQPDPSNNGYCSLDNLVEAIEYAVKLHNVRHFFIDHLHYFLKTSTASNPTAVIDETVRAIRQLSVKHGIHIFLAVHPTKVGADKNGSQNKIGIESAKGSSSIAQESDNYIVVEKSCDGVSEVRFEKNREEGLSGNHSCYFRLTANFNSFYECFNDKQTEETLTEKQERQMQYESIKDDDTGKNSSRF